MQEISSPQANRHQMLIVHWRRFLFMIALALVGLNGVAGAEAEKPIVTLKTKSAIVAVGVNGELQGIVSKAEGKNYLADVQAAPLLSVRMAGKWRTPNKAVWDSHTKSITLGFAEPELSIVIAATTKPSHIVFEITSVHAPDTADLFVWGPYPTTINAIIGETVGVVRDEKFAIGIQSLNAKTLGGFPTEENDIEAEWSGNDGGKYPNLEAELLKDQHYRGDTARKTAFGSVLQAFYRNRHQQRIIPNWGHEKYLVKPFEDGGPVGSKIALFGCPADQALKTIGAIEVAENLPHPTINGVWAKMSPEATASYLIVDFSEENVDRAIEMTRRAGLKHLYHSSPFETWGHFKLKPEFFPHGWEGFRACVEKARKAGVAVGFHTLSNFITPNDPYVTPVPDRRLAIIGSSELAGSIDRNAKEIPIVSPEYFAKKTAMNTVKIDDELIRYGSVSTEAPYRLLECQRGAWGTVATDHAQGDKVGKLLDHEYNVFLSDADLSQEIARNIAGFHNRTGALQLSFDGLEGNWSTGYGQYGRTLFTKAWNDALSPELKGRVINDASNPGHFNWHMNTRMNWGEPWYAGFRESQTLYRFKNQVYFERNYFPHMLGWFALRSETSVEDAEWLLARAAGLDAGFTLATSLASTAQLAADPNSAAASQIFGATGEILEAVSQWETARQARAFTPEARAALRDNRREFHLQPVKKNVWNLTEAHFTRFTLNGKENAFGEFKADNLDAPQPLQWIVQSTAETPIRDFQLAINGIPIAVAGNVAIPAGGYIRYRGGSEALVCDASWHEVARIAVNSAKATLPTGPYRISFHAASFTGSLKIECRTYGAPLRLTGKASRK
jgi:hypothetical protein